MLLHTDRVSVADLAAGTGWQVKPEGACKDQLCVPLPDEAWVDDDVLNVDVVAGRLGMPVLRDRDHELIALGPATVVGRALESAVASELELPDIDGNPFQLSSLLGKKVLLVAWASW